MRCNPIAWTTSYFKRWSDCSEPRRLEASLTFLFVHDTRRGKACLAPARVAELQRRTAVRPYKTRL